MDKINRHNYEAYFLDFAEGNLSEDERRLVLDFIQANPDLKEELEEFEIISIPAKDEKPENWNSLKKEKEYCKSIDLRDELYFNSLEGQLSQSEKSVLEELLLDQKFAAEYELWKRVVLKPVVDGGDWTHLYQTGFDKTITKSNFEYFLFARAEGLLSKEQNEKLQELATQLPNGKTDMELSDKLRLKAPSIFYPDKEKLYRKKERAGLLIWFARSAAVAALFIFGYFLVGQFQKNTNIQIAGQVKSDSTKTDTPQKEKIKPEEPGSIAEIPITSGQKNPNKAELEKANIRKPAKTETTVPVTSVHFKQVNPITAKPVEFVNSLNTSRAIALRNDKGIQETDTTEPLQTRKPNYDDYQTLPQLAEDYLASRFDVSQTENRGFVPTITQKIAERAGKALNAEIKTEESQENNQSKFTFRVGSLKVTRTNSK